MLDNLTRDVPLTFDEANIRIRETLKEQGFGIITEIDVRKTFKEKLDKDFTKYAILGACHPSTAHRVLSHNKYLGLLLPCNVIVWENEDQTSTIAVIDVPAMMELINDPELNKIAQEIGQKLSTALASV